MVSTLKSRAVVRKIARTALTASLAAAAAQLGAANANAQSRPDATSYSQRYAPAGSIGRHEVRTIQTDLGTMVCNGGGDRAYTGRGYQPNDGVGRNFYRVPGNDTPTGGRRSCRWTSTVRPEIRVAPPVARPPVRAPRATDCKCSNGG